MQDSKNRLTSVIEKYACMKTKFMDDRLHKLRIESANMIEEGFDSLVERYGYCKDTLAIYSREYRDRIAACICEVSLSHTSIEFMSMLELQHSLDYIDRTVKRHVVAFLSYQKEKLEIESFSMNHQIINDRASSHDTDNDGTIDGCMIDGKKISKNMAVKSRSAKKLPSREAVLVLKQWLNRHKENPYPTKTDKIFLARLAGLSTKQVDVWFVNYRMRHAKKEITK